MESVETYETVAALKLIQKRHNLQICTKVHAYLH